jgi:hypothetical protein
VVRAELDKRRARVLATPIGVENHPTARTALLQCHRQRIDHEFGAQMIGNRPPTT